MNSIAFNESTSMNTTEPLLSVARRSSLRAANFDLDAYLQRIKFTGRPQANIDSIAGLMRHQLRSVPFENIDVLNGKGVSLQPADIVDKIVNRGRGGYCFEVNGLFAMALYELGIEFDLIACRPLVFMQHRPKTHMLVLARLDGERWMCDLGYGKYGIREPLNLAWLDREIVQGPDRFQLSHDDDGNYFLSANIDGQWLTQLEFNLTPWQWIDFEPANHYTSTHPNSVFVNGPFVQVLTEHGRIVLFGDELKTYDQGRMCGTEKISQETLPELLLSRFGIVYP